MHYTTIADTDFCVFAITLRIVTRLTLLSMILGGMQSGGYDSLLSGNKLILCHEILTDDCPCHTLATKWVPIAVEMKHGFLCCATCLSAWVRAVPDSRTLTGACGVLLVNLGLLCSLK
jgi:sulfite exporter TauE/SafE